MKRVMVVSFTDDTSELEHLARSLDYEVVGVHVQRRRTPDPTFYIGKGKVEDLQHAVKVDRVEIVLLNHDLKPVQLFNLEKTWGCKVFDRTRLILEIFTDRARDQEAKLQIELAKLQYEVPYVKELVHRSRQGEHPGFMGGGEYQVDQYLKIIKKKIGNIKERLDGIVVEREAKRRRRREGGFFLVSVAGYTNAGKSSLLAKVTDAEPIIEERYFSTLYPSTKRGKRVSPGTEMLLFTDTVGFISGLPPAVIESFRSTLEEIYLADLVLFVVDLTDAEGGMVHKIRSGLSYINDGGGSSGIIYVFNKVDRAKEILGADGPTVLKDKVQERLMADGVDLSNHVVVSCETGEGIEHLISKIKSSLADLSYVHHITVSGNRDSMFITIGNDVGLDLVNWLFMNTMVYGFDVPSRDGDVSSLMSFEILCKEREYRKLMNMNRDLKLSIIDHEKPTRSP